MKAACFLVLALLVGLVIDVPLHAAFDGAAVNRTAKPFTSELPAIDKIEVYQLKTTNEGHVKGVVATRLVGPEIRRKIVDLWHRQEYDWHFAEACFDPAYAVLFWHDGKLIVEGQICFACSQIVFTREVTKGDIHDSVAYQGFNGCRPQARELHKLLDGLFVIKAGS